MPSRLRALTQPVAVTHDGDRLEGEAGETLAHTLLAADRLVLTRSPKLHRPRGPYCLRGACEGCLVRVDGVPNVMACRHRVRGGETVETQNVVGSRELDLLAATDFMFPHGLDHHRLLAGVRGVSAVVTRLARRVAGLGKLPDAERAVRRTELREVPVLVIGGGEAGLSAAAELGSRAWLVDDDLELGGSLRLLAPERNAELVARARRGGANLRAETTAIGLYPGPDASEPRITAILAGSGRAHAVVARYVVLAVGDHDAPLDFTGNDLPGVLSARAGVALLDGGVLPDPRTLLVGTGPLLDRARELLGSHAIETVPAEHVVGAEGRLRLQHVIVEEPDGAKRRIRAGALLCSTPGSPVFELAAQAGARVEFDSRRGYFPVLDADGRAAPNVYCAAASIERSASEVGREIGQRVARLLDA